MNSLFLQYFRLKVKGTMQIINKGFNSVFLKSSKKTYWNSQKFWSIKAKLKTTKNEPKDDNIYSSFCGYFDSNNVPATRCLVLVPSFMMRISWFKVACSERHTSHPDEHGNQALSAFFCAIVCQLNKTNFTLYNKWYLLSIKCMEYGDIYRRLYVSTFKSIFSCYHVCTSEIIVL